MPLAERTEATLAEAKASLQTDGITHILCLAEGPSTSFPPLPLARAMLPGGVGVAAPVRVVWSPGAHTCACSAALDVPRSERGLAATRDGRW